MCIYYAYMKKSSKDKKADETKILTCNRCGYTWIARDADNPPKQCANRKCRSPYYNKPRKLLSKMPAQEREQIIKNLPVMSITESNT